MKCLQEDESQTESNDFSKIMSLSHRKVKPSATVQDNSEMLKGTWQF